MKLAFYPGCSLDSTATEYRVSVEKVAARMGMELQEIPDWNCCGASSAHNTDKLLSYALPARNLAIAEEMGLDVLVPCAACYSRFRAVQHVVRENPDMRQKIAQATGREYEARISTLSTLEWLRDQVGVAALAERVTRKLTGLKVASYYGCLLVRPVGITGFDDPEHPTSMDEVVKALGATPVDWAFKTECCGAGLATSRNEIGKKLIHDILKDARDNGADCIVTACPLCQMNLDMRQPETEQAYNERFNIPVYYITELAAIALGEDYRTIGVDRHFVEAVKLLEDIKNRPVAEDKPKGKPARAKAEPKTDPEAASAGTGAGDNRFQPLAQKVLGDDNLAASLAELMAEDETKAQKLQELIDKDGDKARKLALAYLKKAGIITGEEGANQ